MTKQLTPELNLVDYHQIPVLEISHPKVTAKVALQGAQLLSWKPSHTAEDVLWLSEIEPFEQGNAIRGGVPICYPWFGGAKQPPHGTARNRLWELSAYQVDAEQVKLEFSLFDEQQQLEAKMEMELGSTCQLRFTHLAESEAQVALHSYFKVKNIEQVELFGLPDNAFDAVTQQRQAVSSPRKIANLVDEVYTANQQPSLISDSSYQRQIEVDHHNASEVVVWNPWHKAMSGMSEMGYQTMVCVETARIHQLVRSGEQVSVKISVKDQ
ncbi:MULTISPECIES: D-hexose-6-phosphate mutarotase [Glaesserella]|uniref:Putative glucose-6-phosphate 1-epimerase n=1 Tax=Glaesserella australis TaxID=2094024 RepID=A0A328C417_9PAST|nr:MULTISPECIES: D-hexose-6-phosphate mutarotase [Glaesserella]AUI66252.1 D-hexose-6-phosphate mutarotase [Glaesserella sp. 15-184]RAL19274.1 D-hexose-6-phosphate mutarotase [Glaesserella australis]